MLSQSLRNTALILQREYLQRVRTRSFVVSTLLAPTLIIAIMVVPVILAGPQGRTAQRLVVVSPDRRLADLVRSQLSKSGANYRVEFDPQDSEQERRRLNDEVSASVIDGYISISPALLAAGKVVYSSRTASDYVEQRYLQSALTLAVMRYRLAERGVRPSELDKLLEKVNLETIRVGSPQTAGGADFNRLLTASLLVVFLYVTVLSYGVAVMRSVLEEKNSRVMEVVMVAATAKELMAGKIIGVGAVGLTQILIWMLMVALIGGAAGLHSGLVTLASLTPAVGVFFGVFFILGYLLYSAMAAALGAAFNSQEEAQQWNFVILSPLIFSTLMIMSVFRAPNSLSSVVLSMVPFCAPVLMYLRIVVERPPAWQLALCIALMIATIYVLLVACARIYRVGILMYGKRPTALEIARWLRYA